MQNHAIITLPMPTIGGGAVVTMATVYTGTLSKQNQNEVLDEIHEHLIQLRLQTPPFQYCLPN